MKLKKDLPYEIWQPMNTQTEPWNEELVHIYCDPEDSEEKKI